MIRALAHSGDGKPVVLLGLDPQNLDRLREGQPILVNLRNLVPGAAPIEELPDLDVVILFGGEDELRLLESVARRDGADVRASDGSARS